MARVTGPLMSMDASGTIAGAIVFSRWKGLPYVRRHAIPSNPRTHKQVGVRAMMSFLAREYAGLTDGDKETWALLAETMHQSAFNRFVGFNAAQWAMLYPPTQRHPAAAAGTEPSAPTLIVVGGLHTAAIGITKGDNAPNWGYFLFGKAATPVPKTPEYVVAVVPYSANTTPVYVNNLLPGDWFFTAKGFMADGVIGAASAEAHDDVT